LKEKTLKIPTAIVGLGKVGLHYDIDEFGNFRPSQVMTHCRAVSESKYFEITHLIDTQLDTVRKAQYLYGGQGFQSISSTFGLDTPQFVIVAVPTSSHLEVINDIINSWNPHLFLIEKPFGSSSSAARHLKDLLEKQNARVFVNYFRRYLPNVNLLKSSGAFAKRGTLESVKINGYGSLENIFSHFLDLLIALETSEIIGTTKKVNLPADQGEMRFIDPTTGITFELNGVGLESRPCEMSLVYDTCMIQMNSSGRSFEILDRAGLFLDEFTLENSVFDSYQSIVLSTIGEILSLAEKNDSMDDAIRVHDFLESI
jgi:hypothetical protein